MRAGVLDFITTVLFQRLKDRHKTDADLKMHLNLQIIFYGILRYENTFFFFLKRTILYLVVGLSVSRWQKTEIQNKAKGKQKIYKICHELTVERKFY